jgi:hypothetical protein
MYINARDSLTKNPKFHQQKSEYLGSKIDFRIPIQSHFHSKTSSTVYDFILKIQGSCIISACHLKTTQPKKSPYQTIIRFIFLLISPHLEFHKKSVFYLFCRIIARWHVVDTETTELKTQKRDFFRFKSEINMLIKLYENSFLQVHFYSSNFA